MGGFAVDRNEPTDRLIYESLRTRAPARPGKLPLTHEILSTWPSGDLFGLSQSVGMGCDPSEVLRDHYLILNTHGGIRQDDGTPLALGFHTGHWEIPLLVREAATVIRELGGLPFAVHCSDPCDGRTQGTPGMMDSLPYRNDAAIVLRRLARSLPTRKAILGVATCDKGLPAMMMALAGLADLPSVIIPGGVTLMPEEGEDAGKVQTIGARYVHGEITLEQAALAGCRACASPGGGCQFLGTAATSQVVAEALGWTVPHAALAPSGLPVWLDVARRSAEAAVCMVRHRQTTRAILTQAALENAMTVHAAFGGSTNLLIHIPAIAFEAGLERPTVQQWIEINRRTPRIVDALPNGPVGYPTVVVYLAGGVPEVMLHLREANLLHTSARTVTGSTWDAILDWWEKSDRRKRMKERLYELEGIDPEDVIMPPARARSKGLAPTITFPGGNLAPQGAVIKSTAIDRSLLDARGVYRHVGPARVFTRESDAIRAIKEQGPTRVRPGDVVVLICAGPLGTGMEEIYQVTAALKHLSWGKHVAVLTDARFSGVSTGACIGHISPEALAGGPIGKLLDDDIIEIIVDTVKLEGIIDLIGHGTRMFGPSWGDEELQRRPLRPDLRPREDLPRDTRLWAALQDVSGGVWGGCVYDVDRICTLLQQARSPGKSGA